MRLYTGSILVGFLILLVSTSVTADEFERALRERYPAIVYAAYKCNHILRNDPPISEARVKKHIMEMEIERGKRYSEWERSMTRHWLAQRQAWRGAKVCQLFRQELVRTTAEILWKLPTKSIRDLETLVDMNNLYPKFELPLDDGEFGKVHYADKQACLRDRLPNSFYKGAPC